MFALQDWVQFDKFAARPAAQARLRRFAKKKPPNSFLEELENWIKYNVCFVGSALCDELEWGKPKEDCHYLAKRVLS